MTAVATELPTNCHATSEYCYVAPNAPTLPMRGATASQADQRRVAFDADYKERARGAKDLLQLSSSRSWRELQKDIRARERGADVKLSVPLSKGVQVRLTSTGIAAETQRRPYDFVPSKTTSSDADKGCYLEPLAPHHLRGDKSPEALIEEIASCVQELQKNPHELDSHLQPYVAMLPADTAVQTGLGALRVGFAAAGAACVGGATCVDQCLHASLWILTADSCGADGVCFRQRDENCCYMPCLISTLLCPVFYPTLLCCWALPGGYEVGPFCPIL